MPSLIVIAGPNGSGKSTLYRRLSKRISSFGKIPFINPDEVAKELFGKYLRENTTQARIQTIAAWKETSKRRKSLLVSRESFGFETTFSGNSEIHLIRQARMLGYKVILVFVGLDDPALNIMRVNLRVQNGGHFVDPKDIVRRWQRSMNNLKEIHADYNRLYLIDNSNEGHRVIAIDSMHQGFRTTKFFDKKGTHWYTDFANYITEWNRNFLSLARRKIPSHREPPNR